MRSISGSGAMPQRESRGQRPLALPAAPAGGEGESESKDRAGAKEGGSCNFFPCMNNGSRGKIGVLEVFLMDFWQVFGETGEPMAYMLYRLEQRGADAADQVKMPRDPRG